MHWYRDKLSGKECLWIDEDEFESITENELRAAALYPTAERPVVDIERFIQRHMKIALNQYADLDEGIAGAIEFNPSQTKIFINRQLTDMADKTGCSAGTRGRWRATMAHEASHGLFHQRIFETSSGQGVLFEEVAEEAQSLPQIIQCGAGDIGFGLGGYDWREYQANRGMAALLMPRQIFCELAKEEMYFIVRHGKLVLSAPGDYGTLIQCLARRFEVSRQAASIRLKALEATVGIGQSTLIMSNA